MISLTQYLEYVFFEGESSDEEMAEEVATRLIRERIKDKDMIKRILNAFGFSDNIKQLVLAKFV